MKALYASFSFVRMVSKAERMALLEEITGIVDRDFGGRAPNVVLSPLYLACAAG